jgi:hypothetical protein
VIAGTGDLVPGPVMAVMTGVGGTDVVGMARIVAPVVTMAAASLMTAAVVKGAEQIHDGDADSKDREGDIDGLQGFHDDSEYNAAPLITPLPPCSGQPRARRQGER